MKRLLPLLVLLTSTALADDLERTVATMARIGFANSPSFSPDGKQVAFLSNMSGSPQIWVVSTDGGWPDQVTALDDPVTAIDQMLRVYRFACSEKRRTLDDLLRLAERLRADMGRLGATDGAVRDGQSSDDRRQRLLRSVADIEATVERARGELGVAEAELARVEQMKQGRETADKTSTQRRNERAAGLGRQR